MVASTPQGTGPVSPGELLAGKYRVERILGEGGMGVVVGAMNEALRQRVAIKLLRPTALSDREALGRFVREARAAASLRSEHVARVLDTGTLDDGRPFIVMEHLQGRDLGDVVERDPPLGLNVAVDYVLQACEAIAEAHAAGIVHRDLKPKNLFLTTTAYGKPHVKVLDFGISKIEEAQELQLTATTQVMGSPSYMSPEQLRSARDVDARTDIWALGVILYELLTKRLPFNAATVTQLVAVVLTERERPVQSLRPDVPDALAHAIERCLAKRPEDRYGTVIDLVSALEPYASGGFASPSDRVRGVALASGRTLPDAASSGQLPSVPPAAHSGPALGGSGSGATFAMAATSEWPPAAASGAHSVATAKRGRSPWAILVGVGGVGVLVAGAAAAGAAYVKHSGTSTAADAPPPTVATEAPRGAGALPAPGADAAEVLPQPPTPKTSELAGGPEAEGPDAAAPAPETPSARRTPKRRAPGGRPPATESPTPAPPDDDPLSNIGRR
jgi:eukaryotic-like serine/threonine-protein kinase